MSAQREIKECCICMDDINASTNNCVTPCGHAFCFNCLAKSLEQNNTCPYCRAKLMEEPEEDDEDDWTQVYNEEEEEEEVVFDDYSLRGFRWLFQRVNGEEFEDELDSNDEEETEVVNEDTEEGPIAEVEAITEKLQSRGITMLDLVLC